jgi:transcription initiation factor TFIIB
MLNLACRFHPEAHLLEDSRAGDMICTECGRVVGERYDYLNEKNFSDEIFHFRMIDVGSEWRTFASESDSVDMNRVGAAENRLYDFNSLETTTSFVPKRTFAAPVQSKFENKISQVIFLFY